jgi:hypothetical protein
MQRKVWKQKQKKKKKCLELTQQLYFFFNSTCLKDEMSLQIIGIADWEDAIVLLTFPQGEI